MHSVKTRIKDMRHLMEKLIRKTPNRREKYGEDFKFTVDNYKDEITDLLGIRVIHIFKEDWEEIHNFITSMWNVMEIVANVREDDLLIITADHGNDPTWTGSDHTREFVPVLFYEKDFKEPKNLGTLEAFATIGKTIADIYNIRQPEIGDDLKDILK